MSGLTHWNSHGKQTTVKRQSSEWQTNGNPGNPGSPSSPSQPRLYNICMHFTYDSHKLHSLTVTHPHAPLWLVSFSVFVTASFRLRPNPLRTVRYAIRWRRRDRAPAPLTLDPHRALSSWQRSWTLRTYDSRMSIHWLWQPPRIPAASPHPLR